ncbi:MAG: hypothetical protein V1809_00670 [Planctomycetota bacterium]
MSTVSKIFVVLLLVLSVFYCGIAALLFVTAEDWKAKTLVKVKEYDTLKQEKEEQAKKYDEQIVKLKADLDKLNVALQDKEDEIKVLNNDKIKLDADKRDLQNKHDKLQVDHNSLIDVHKKEVDKNARLSARIATVERDLNEAQLKKEESDNHNIVLDAENNKLSQDVGDLRRALQKSNEQLDDRTWRLAQIAKQYGIALDPVPGETPRIESAVSAVRPDTDLVMIAVGSRDKVKEGMVFFVYGAGKDGPEYKGEVLVERVLPNMAATRPVHDRMKQVDGKEVEIRSGDKVTTVLY